MEQIPNFIINSVLMILDKYAEPLINTIRHKVGNEWDKFRVDFDIAFKSYTVNAYRKYCYMKTIFYRAEPQYIYDFFEYPVLKKSNQELVNTVATKNITDLSHFILIRGSVGMGKSTLLKHLFINELSARDLIPIFIELNDINYYLGEMDIEDIVLSKLTDLGTSMNRECLVYALKTGCFLFLMDGYDEILTEHKFPFLFKLNTFCDRYPDNYFILSSRPYGNFLEFYRFTILAMCSLTKKQAASLASKLDSKNAKTLQFLKVLNAELYDQHDAFASNPLLLNILLMTFENFTTVPGKLHLFYRNAFDTIYQMRDRSTFGCTGGFKSVLSYDSFIKVFSQFCYKTYVEGQAYFSHQELSDYIKNSKPVDIDFCIEDYIYDLENTLCVLYKEGFSFKFAYKSFQEYFTALFIKDLPDKQFEKISLYLIEKDTPRVVADDVFTMLFDMAAKKSERYILHPLIVKLETEYSREDKYNYFCKCIFGQLIINPANEIDNAIYNIQIVASDYKLFLYHIVKYFVSSNQDSDVDDIQASNELYAFLNKSRLQHADKEINIRIILEHPTSAQFFKRMLPGRTVDIITNILYKQLTFK